MTIPTARLEEIRELAAKATQGKWLGAWSFKPVNQNEPDNWWVAEACGPRLSARKTDATAFKAMSDQVFEDSAHIANCDPQTISAIVSELIERRNKDAEHA